MQRVTERLKLVVPFTLFLILFLLYANTKSLAKTLIVVLAVPFSVVGAVWLLWALDYNVSIAVWVGMIALMGLDAETGVFMLLFLDLAYDEAKAKGRLRSMADLHEAIVHGAVKRLRPKMMTVDRRHDRPHADHVVDGHRLRRDEAGGRAHGGRPRHVLRPGAPRLPRDLPALALAHRSQARRGPGGRHDGEEALAREAVASRRSRPPRGGPVPRASRPGHLGGLGAATLARCGGGSSPTGPAAPSAAPGNALRLPPELSGPLLEAAARQGEVWPGRPTGLLTLGGAYPSPTIRVPRGGTLSVRLGNRLSEPTNVHWHGLTAPAAMDGFPTDLVAPGASRDFAVPILERAGTYWYHPHPDGQTARQVYQGMAGFLIVEDPAEGGLGLPTGDRDVPLLLQDRRSSPGGAITTPRR